MIGLALWITLAVLYFVGIVWRLILSTREHMVDQWKNGQRFEDKDYTDAVAHGFWPALVWPVYLLKDFIGSVAFRMAQKDMPKDPPNLKKMFDVPEARMPLPDYQAPGYADRTRVLEKDPAVTDELKKVRPAENLDPMDPNDADSVLRRAVRQAPDWSTLFAWASENDVSPAELQEAIKAEGLA